MSVGTPPLVSVLLPVWNAATTLPTCLWSIQRQTEPHWQCVIVDQGLVPALNTGLAYCQGRFIARMDADDVMHRQRLAVQVQAMAEQPELVAVGCHVRCFPRQHLQDGWRAYERWLNGMRTAGGVQREAFVECPIAHPTLLIRREVLAVLGYRDCGWPEDYDVFLRLITQGHAIGVVPRRLLSWRDGPQRLSRTSSIYALERFTACKAAFLAASFLAATDTYILWGYGDTGKTLRRALLAYNKCPSYIVEIHPGRLGNRIHGALVIPPTTLLQVPRRPVVISVAGTPARHAIRQAMAGMGFRESRDFVCAA
jgi:hypothetical protein